MAHTDEVLSSGESMAFTMPQRITFVALIVAGLALSGCAVSGNSAEAASPKQTLSAASESPSESPNPTHAADTSAWVIGFDSVGPLKVGSPLDAAPSVAAPYIESSPNECPHVLSLGLANAPTILLPDPMGAGVIEQIVVQAWGNAAGATALSPATAEGIRIGSTLDGLNAAYADREEIAGRYASFYSVADNNRNVNFAVNESGVVDAIIVRDAPMIDSEYCG